MKYSLRQFRYLYILALICLFGVPNQSTANPGLEISYRWVADSTYEITLVFNTNCYGFGTIPPTSANVKITSASNSITNTVVCPRLSFWGPSMPYVYNCLDTAYCTQQWIYRGTWTSPKKANDWLFSYETLCCFSVLVGPVNMTIDRTYAECGLNNLDFPDTLNKNISGFFHNPVPNHPGYTSDTVFNPPVLSVCESRNVTLDESVRNYDGDSVSYSFYVPQGLWGTPYTYNAGYSFTDPVPSKSGPITIDPLTGQINFIPDKPSGTGVYLVGIKATEYRRDTMTVNNPMKEIGFVKRNLFVIIEDSATCPDQNITFSDTSSSGMADSIITLNCHYQSFEIKMTDYILCSSVDTNGSCVQLRDPATSAFIPVKSISRNDCNSDKLSKSLIINLHSIPTSDTLELVFKKGGDGNTLLSECSLEVEEYSDTLLIAFITDFSTGEFRGDKISKNNYDSSISVLCGDTNFVLNLSEKVWCNSVAADGSDFYLYNNTSSSITNVIKSKPVCNAEKTDRLILFTDSLIEGDYWLILKQGTDSNKLLSLCYENWTIDSIPLNVKLPNPNLGPDTTYCVENELFYLILDPGQFDKYNWSTGDTTQAISVQVSGTYWVEVSNEFDCKNIDTILVDSIRCYNSVESISNLSYLIHPNPCSEELFIDIETNEKFTVKLYNTLGALLFTRDFSPGLNSIDVSGFRNGIYWMEIFLDEKRIVQQFQVQK